MRSRQFLTILAGLGVLSLTFAPAAAAAAAATTDDAHAKWKMIETYCFDCHNTEDWAGGVAFDSMDASGVSKEGKIWETTIKKLKSGMMPPISAKQHPDSKQVSELIGWLETTLDSSQARPYVGEIPLRRLNRREYANSIKDLIGLNIDPATYLPADELKEGFDTDATALRFTPSFLDQAVSAARTLALHAVGDIKTVPLDNTYGPVPNMILSLSARPAEGSGSQRKYQDGMPFGTRGGMQVEHMFLADGEYLLSIGDMALARTVPNMEFENTLIALLDGKEFYRTNIGGEPDHKSIDQQLDDAVSKINGRLKEIPFRATAGQHKVAVTFLRRSYAEHDDRSASPRHSDDGRGYNVLEGGQQRLPAVHALYIKGPVKTTGMSDSVSRQKIFICKPASAAEEPACAQRIVSNLARKAFRRPVTNDDLAPLLRFYDVTRKNGESFDVGIRESLSAVLASPLFLYRAETAVEQGSRNLTDLELASRMSFFMWSSLPDDELLGLAEKNELSKPAVLKAQVQRMLRDDRAISLTRDFAFQWLNVAKLDQIVPARGQFGHAAGVYDVRQAFKKELELFMDSILRSDRSVVDLLTADHTFMNEQVAQVYGLTEVRGNGFRRVTLIDPKRFGLLGKGAILTLTANPNRTAPVLRGAWILERILGTPPATPPPNVEQLPANLQGRAATVRERTETHRKNPACASCHAVMDPLGFALEGFDTVGAYHTIDAASRQPIDTAATLPDGTKISGPEDLHKALASRGDQLAQVITEKLMTYGVGRHVDHRDMPSVRSIVRTAKASNYRFEDLVLGVVNSAAFRQRSAPAPLPAATTAQTASVISTNVSSAP
jgi:mono/diheme cytochrome c family protein